MLVGRGKGRIININNFGGHVSKKVAVLRTTGLHDNLILSNYSKYYLCTSLVTSNE